MMSLGSKLRQVRGSASLTLSEVANRSGLSVSYLSQIERSVTNPSIGALNRICEALDVRMGEFFASESDSDSSDRGSEHLIGIVRQDRRKIFTYPGSEIRHEMLCPDLQHTLEIFQTYAPPGADSGDIPLSHEGEEVGIVLVGNMKLHLGDETYFLEEGQTICFNSKVPHSWENADTVELQVIWVITPPHY